MATILFIWMAIQVPLGIFVGWYLRGMRRRELVPVRYEKPPSGE